MRRLRLLCSLLLLLVLTLGVIPARADVIEVNPDQPIQITSDKAVVQKIIALQGQVSLIPYSAISPNDDYQLVVVVQYGEVALVFLNIKTGAIVPVKLEEGVSIQPLTGPAWLDDKTLLLPALLDGVPSFLSVDATTGAIKATPVELPGQPLSLSPNGQKLLIAYSGDTVSAYSENKKAALPASPFDRTVKLSMKDEQGAAYSSFLSQLYPAERARFAGTADTASTLQVASAGFNIAAIDLKAGTIAPLFSVGPYTTFPGIAWSQDSSQLAITRYEWGNLSGQYGGGNAFGDFLVEDATGRIPPEKNPLYLTNQVDTVNFAAGTVRVGLLKAVNSGTLDIYWGVSWSTDNATLLTHVQKPSRLAGRANPVYLIGESTYLRFYTADGSPLNTFVNDEINAIPINAQSNPVFVSPDEVLINATRTTNNRIYYYNRTTGEFRQLPIPDGDASQMQPTNKSRSVLFTYSSFAQAVEHYSIGWDGSNLKPLTAVNTKLTAAAKVQADPVSFTLSSGATRNGYLLQPAGATFPPQPGKMIVWQEGGPTGGMLNSFNAAVERPFNLLPNFGYSVLFVPLPGRVGYGPQFLNALADNKNYGQIDIDEMAEIVQQTVQRGYTSPGNIGIMGCSYGGYFTSQSIARNPTLYSAANSQCTLADMFTEVQFDQTAVFGYLEGSIPTTDAAEYIKDSPLFSSSRIKTPLLLFHGTLDFIPIGTAINFHDQVRNNGAAVNLLAFVGEGHGLRLPTNEVIAAQSLLDWFGRYLGGGNATQAKK